MYKEIGLKCFLLASVLCFQNNNYGNSFEPGIYTKLGLSQEEIVQRVKSEIRNDKINIITQRLFQASFIGLTAMLTAVAMGGLYLLVSGDNTPPEVMGGLGMASFSVLVPVLIVPIIDTQNNITMTKERIEKFEKLKKQYS